MWEADRGCRCGHGDPGAPGAESPTGRGKERRTRTGRASQGGKTRQALRGDGSRRDDPIAGFDEADSASLLMGAGRPVKINRPGKMPAYGERVGVRGSCAQCNCYGATRGCRGNSVPGVAPGWFVLPLRAEIRHARAEAGGLEREVSSESTDKASLASSVIGFRILHHDTMWMGRFLSEPEATSMVDPGINPHRLSLAGPREAALLEEPDRSPVGDQDVHVEGLVPAS